MVPRFPFKSQDLPPVLTPTPGCLSEARSFVTGTRFCLPVEGLPFWADLDERAQPSSRPTGAKASRRGG